MQKRTQSPRLISKLPLEIRHKQPHLEGGNLIMHTQPTLPDRVVAVRI